MGKSYFGSGEGFVFRRVEWRLGGVCEIEYGLGERFFFESFVCFFVDVDMIRVSFFLVLSRVGKG